MTSNWKDKRNNGGVPERWLNCPRKAGAFISEKFLVFKTPLSSDYNEHVPIQHRFPPKMIFDYMQSKKVCGIWSKLTN